MIDTSLPVVPVAILIVGAYFVPLFRRAGPKASATITLACLTASAVLIWYMAWLTARGTTIRYYVGGWAPPFGIEIVIGPLEAFLLSTIAAVALAITVWSIGGLKHEVHRQGTAFYYTVFLLLIAGMAGMAMAADLFNLYVFLEMSGIATCALVAARGDRKSTAAAFKYVILNALGSAFVLAAIGMVYMVTGNLNIAYIKQELPAVWPLYSHLLWTAVSFFVVGFGIKSALFPLHLWLPDAHSSAPAPASALLSGLVVKVYAFSLLRIAPLMVGMPGAEASREVLYLGLLVLASAAIIGGSAFALVQTTVKRLLAYSTVAQVGYIYLGLALGGPALIAAYFHIVAHALMKSCLFLAAGTMSSATGAKKISDYDGMSRRQPVVMAAFAVGAASMIGLPGFAGLISKWYLATGAIEAGMPVFAILMVVSGLLNAAYYLPVLERAYLRPPARPFASDLPPAPSMVWAVVVLAAGCIVLGVAPGWTLQFISSGLPLP